jgi:hypothetical protein
MHTVPSWRSSRNEAIAHSVSFAERVGQPHQFRTRNDLTKPQQTRSNLNENSAKSTNPINFPSLITVWLQVRVLPGPPRFALRATHGAATRGRGAKRVRRSWSEAEAKTDWSRNWATAPETCSSSSINVVQFALRATRGAATPRPKGEACPA